MRRVVPAHVMAIRNRLMAEAKEPKDCTRCSGLGQREDNPNWRVVEERGVAGKICFRCRGSGREPTRDFVDPLRVRYAVAYRLLPYVEEGDVLGIEAEQDGQEGSVYWPILMDVFERAIAAARRSQATRVPDEPYPWEEELSVDEHML